jgi:hypothetical protein
MLDDSTYRVWTNAFGPGGYFKGSWEQGAKILFVGADPESGKEAGMVSRIAENRPHEFLSIEHLGITNDGVEDTTSELARQWAPAHENYTFSEENGVTEVTVDVDVHEEQTAEFEKMWPEALGKLKEISERL